MLIPKLLPTPFADEGRKNTIPQVKPVDAGAHLASFELGFPPITMQPKADGGLPPDGMDVNGILYDTTAHISYLNKGGQYKFNEEYSNLIGGYPKGAILLSDDENYQYISLIDSNTDNFNDELSENWSVISIINIDQLLNDKVSSTTMAQALLLKADKSVSVIAGQGLKGGGKLESNITLNVDIDSITPVGLGMQWFTSVAPSGWLFMRGQSFTAIQYPKLALLFPSLKLPDFRGVVPRGFDDGRGFDQGRALLSYQEDTMQIVKGTAPVASREQVIDDGVFSDSKRGVRVQFEATGTSFIYEKELIIDSSLTCRTANESRMKNISINFIIKAG